METQPFVLRLKKLLLQQRLQTILQWKVNRLGIIDLRGEEVFWFAIALTEVQIPYSIQLTKEVTRRTVIQRAEVLPLLRSELGDELLIGHPFGTLDFGRGQPCQLSERQPSTTVGLST